MNEVLLLWQVGLIANVKLHFLPFAAASSFLCTLPDTPNINGSSLRVF